MQSLSKSQILFCIDKKVILKFIWISRTLNSQNNFKKNKVGDIKFYDFKTHYTATGLKVWSNGLTSIVRQFKGDNFFQYMVLGKLDMCMQNNEAGTLSYTKYKN